MSKSAAKKLGWSGPQTYLTMNLTCRNKRSKKSEIIDIVLVSPIKKNVEKPLLVHTVDEPCSSVRTVSKKSLEKYNHLSGENVNLLLGTDFSDGFVGIHAIPSGPNKPIAKMNCFGWYVLGQFVPNEYSV